VLLDSSGQASPRVWLIGGPGPAPGFALAALELACRYYGCHLESRAVADLAGLASPDDSVPLLAIVHADVLTEDNWRVVAAFKQCPVALVGIATESDLALVSRFATETIACTRSEGYRGLWIPATTPDQTGYELRGIRFAAGHGTSCGLAGPKTSRLRALAIAGSDESSAGPVLVSVPVDGSVRYLATRWCFSEKETGPALASWAELLPWLLLLRDAGGNRCWHAPAAVANLTIDDPRLVEPYGRLSFPGLLAEMQRVPFHATIGFIPWNYDRNDPAIIELFRANPERLSLAVHGNNHEGYEFFRYEAKPGDTQRSAPHEKQVFNIKQGLARIRAFEAGTGLAVDRVMVFPQAISPAPTLEVLRQHGFLATSNFSNVPLDATLPDDPTAALRSALTDWHDLPAVRRDYPHEYSEEAIAVDLFLGNPVLFMAHQDDFANGIDSFTAHAARVNRRQPAVHWTSLGGIARQLHRVRWLDATTCEVQMTTCQAELTNPAPTATRFTVLLPRSEIRPGTSVRVGGVDHPWCSEPAGIRFELTLPAGGTALVEVFEPLAAAEPVALGRSGLRKRYLRLIADFRDLVISRSKLGRAITEKYYRKLRRPALKTGRGRRRVALLWQDDAQGSPRLRPVLLADLPPNPR